MEIEANLNEMLLEIGVRDMEKHGILCLVLRTRRPHITLQSIQHCSHGFFPLKKKKKTGFRFTCTAWMRKKA
jgi:hypothetical protein